MGCGNTSHKEQHSVPPNGNQTLFSIILSRKYDNVGNKIDKTMWFKFGI
jgi:hypothetical protein